MFNFRELLRNCLSLFKKSERRKIWLLAVAQLSLGILDLFGVALIGVIASLTYSQASGVQPSTRIVSLLSIFSLDDQRVQVQVAIFGLIAASTLIAKSVISFYLFRRIERFMASRTAHISSDLIFRFFSMGLSPVQSQSTHAVVFLLTNGVTNVVRGIIGASITLVADVSLMFVLLVGLFFVEFELALMVIVLYALVGYSLHKYSHQKAHDLALETRALSITSSERIAELQDAFREVYVKNQRDFYAHSISKDRFQIAKNEAELSVLKGFSKYIFEFTFVFGALIISAYQFLTSPASRAVTVLGIFIAASARILPAVLRVQQAMVSIRINEGTAASTLNLIEELSKRPIVTKELKSYVGFEHVGFNGIVDVKNLNFSYGDSSTATLQGIDFYANCGEAIAIVGSSGAGKSTLVDLILGLREPDSGTVLVSGERPIEAIRKWSGAISYVPQKCPIFSGTIMRNIALGYSEEDIDEERCWSVLRTAHLEDFVKSFEDGLRHQVGERGFRLSGGQQQRLGIARALYSKPKLLIFDEATSSLDPITERGIDESIQNLKGQVTVITIAHRIMSLYNSTRIYVLEKGQIVGEGTFEYLSNNSPEFASQLGAMRGFLKQ